MYFAALDIKKVETELVKGDVCAVILEGISGVGGIQVPGEDFLQQLRKLTIRYGVVLILDEIQSGYGRTGKFFAHQWAGIKPDLITVAKGIANGFPFSGVLISPMFAARKGMLGTTFGGNHLGCAAALAVLKIIREDIETQYKERLSEIYEKLETLVEKKDVKKSQIVEHDNYVKELLRYIISDLKRFRQIQGDNTLGGMVICETSEQARKLFAYFDEIQAELNKDASMKSHLRAGLILHDSDDKDTRDKIIDDFKNNMTVDILIVFNMLLTGFDAPRLKRLYFGRKLKDHNLLQAITRVNRPYKENHYGYVIDFANIKRNFEETNEAYLKELNRFNDPNEVGAGNETDTFKQVIEDPAELLSLIHI